MPILPQADRVGDGFDLYPNDGCSDLAIPSCLSCPLPACRYDMPAKWARNYLRRQRVTDLLAEGRTVDQIVTEMGSSRRMVFRYKERLRQDVALPVWDEKEEDI